MYVLVTDDFFSKFKEFGLLIQDFITSHELCLISQVNQRIHLDLPLLEISHNSQTHSALKNSYSLSYEDSNLDLFMDSSATTPNFSFKNKRELMAELENFNQFVIVVRKHFFDSLMSDSYTQINTSKKALGQKMSSEDKELIQKFEKDLYEVAPTELTEFCSSHKSIVSLDLHIFKFDGKTSLDRKNKSLFHIISDNSTYGIYSENNKVAQVICWQLIYEYLNRFNTQQEFRRRVSAFAHQFSHFEFPLALFGETHQFELGNEKFLKLNLSYRLCENYSQLSQVKIEDKHYKFIKIKIFQNNLFILIPIEQNLLETSNPSDQELGIISSSIAHEINNPLAGILAALDYLMLDIEEGELALELQDMKKGVLRCKKLVELFLGFSNRRKDQDLSDVNAFDCIFQAIEMLRYRLAENNLQLHLYDQNKKQQKVKLNQHIFIMINYLVLGELLTEMSHQNLISGSGQEAIDIYLENTQNEVVLKFNFDIEKLRKAFEAKLVIHLLKASQVEVRYQQNYLIYKIL